jgi:hypothetical protein
MGRLPKEDRDAVKSTILAIRLSPVDRALFDRLLKARAEELSRLAGQPLEVTAASYLRWLLLRDAEARGMPPEESELSRARAEMAPPQTPSPPRVKAPVKGPTAAKVRPRR